MSEASSQRSDGLAPPWGLHDLAEGDDRRVRLGPLELRLRRVGEEIWLARSWTDEMADGAPSGSSASSDGSDLSPSPSSVDSGPDPATPSESDSDEVEWSRWAVPEGTRGMRLDPVLPDRPLVVEPERTFHLVRGTRIRVYVRVALWVAVRLPDSAVTLVEIPSMILSDTWFGDLNEGELAYALPTSAHRKLRPELFAPHLAICPLRLGNDVVDQLEVKKLCLRVSHLSLFARGPELWSDETRVRYRGPDDESELSITGMAPPEAPDAVRAIPPREPLQRGFTARTFARLAGFSAFGGST